MRIQTPKRTKGVEELDIHHFYDSLTIENGDGLPAEEVGSKDRDAGCKRERLMKWVCVLIRRVFPTVVCQHGAANRLTR